jgi:hypothetical protein
MRLPFPVVVAGLLYNNDLLPLPAPYVTTFLNNHNLME